MYRIIADKDETIRNRERLLTIKKEQKNEDEIRKAAVDLGKTGENYTSLIEQQKRTPVDAEVFEQNIQRVAQDYDEARNRYEELISESQERERTSFEIERFLSEMKAQKGVLHEFDCDLMKKLVEKIVIHHDGRAVFVFFGGEEVELEI